MNIKIIAANRENISLPNCYDTIIYLEVIEHVSNPREIFKIFSNHLNKQGKLIITQLDCEGSDESNLMHFQINFNAHKLLNSQGLYKSEFYPWLCIKKD